MKKLVVENGKCKYVDAPDNYEQESDWLHNYPLRIVSPKSLALQYPNLYVWFQLNDLPIEKVGDNVHIYVNEIMQDHQDLISSLNGIIVIEQKS